MNGCIDNEIILNRKIRPLVFIYIMVVIISSLSLIIIFMLFHYKIYYFFKGNIIMEEDNYYLKCYIPTSDIKYITSNNTLIIDKKLYKYEVIKISEDYFSDNNITYQEIILEISLDDEYKYNNLMLELKILKDDKRIIDYIKSIWR